MLDELQRKVKTFRTHAWLITIVHKSQLGDKCAKRIIELYNKKLERGC